jgi:acyl-CoA thioesterase I
LASLAARIIAIALLLWTGHGAHAARPAPERVPLPPGTILVVGDSLSAGFGVAVDESWTALLAMRPARKGQPYRVANISVSGQTSAGGRALLPGALARHRPALVILELGANDALRGQDLAATRANLEAMITASRTAGAQLLLVGIELPPNYGPRYTQRLRAMYADLAARTQVALMPFLLAAIALDTALFQPDGLHPTAAGLVRVEDAVWQVLNAHFDLAAGRTVSTR